MFQKSRKRRRAAGTLSGAKSSANAAKGTIVLKRAVKRRQGHLYFIDATGNVREAKLNRRGGKRGRKVCR